MRSKTKVRVFSVIVVGYMLLALAWWAVLLIKKTNLIYELQQQNAEAYPFSKTELLRQQSMITGEAVVFAAAMILGVILLNRAFKREMVAVKQQKNFLLSVTHELKSPITAIQLILDTFKRRNLDPERRDLLIQNGQEEAVRLNKLVEDLLTAARLNPKSTLSKENVDLEAILKTLVEQYNRNYPAYEIGLTKTGENFNVLSNEPSLALIVSNLLDNAIKYSEDQKQVRLDLKKRGNSIVLSVMDQGKGIHESEKKRIFDQFYRIGDENVRTAKGTGLGLYLVQELCTKLNIKITVKDNDPKGSIFELNIPTK